MFPSALQEWYQWMVCDSEGRLVGRAVGLDWDLRLVLVFEACRLDSDDMSGVTGDGGWHDPIVRVACARLVVINVVFLGCRVHGMKVMVQSMYVHMGMQRVCHVQECP